MGLHAYTSILGMELVMAVNDVVTRAQNCERGFGPQTSGTRRNRDTEDQPPPKRPRAPGNIRRRRRVVRRRRSVVGSPPLGTPRWGAMAAGLMTMIGAILLDLRVLLETYLVEQQLFDHAVGEYAHCCRRTSIAFPAWTPCRRDRMMLEMMSLKEVHLPQRKVNMEKMIGTPAV